RLSGLSDVRYLQAAAVSGVPGGETREWDSPTPRGKAMGGVSSALLLGLSEKEASPSSAAWRAVGAVQQAEAVGLHGGRPAVVLDRAPLGVLAGRVPRLSDRLGQVLGPLAAQQQALAAGQPQPHAPVALLVERAVGRAVPADAPAAVLPQRVVTHHLRLLD